ncbi:tyrosine-type recombinase/integrase [Luteitalea sp.]
MKAWQEAARVELRAEREARVIAAASDAQAAAQAEEPAGPGTLEEAATSYLTTVTAMPSYDSRCHDLRAWTKVLGQYPLTALRPVHLLALWNTWKKKGVAVSTRLHRRTALLACLELHNREVAVMARESIPWERDPQKVPEELPYPTILVVLAAMPPSRAAAMLQVMAETGLPPQTIRRLEPADVDLTRKHVRLPPRRKGDGVRGVVLPLTDAGVEAFRVFAARNAWKGVQNQTLGIVWGRGCQAARKAEHTVPHCTPYVLRHSFAGRVLDATGGDLQVLRELLQHLDFDTTLRYAQARAKRAVRVAIDALNRPVDPVQ